MSFNTFGRHLRITSFGESHGPAVGVVLDGVPPGTAVDLAAIQRELDRRRPGAARGAHASGRDEPDRLEVLAGLFEGQTTGAPLCLVVRNRDARPADYAPLAALFRPGHADLSWYRKYGVRDHRGGGRAAGRETVARVAAGAVARQLLHGQGVTIVGCVIEIGGVRAERFDAELLARSPLNCADAGAVALMERVIEEARAARDSLGGVVELRASGVPAGWGDPVFDKLDARLAAALVSIGAVKGVEFGDGFALARSRGSEANDPILGDGFARNRSGGILGGVSSGAEIVCRVAVKPTPSIGRAQQTIDLAGRPATIEIDGRHDVCIAPRLVPVAEAMVALTLADAWLGQQLVQGRGPGG